MKEKGNAGSQVPESEERHGNRLDGRGKQGSRKAERQHPKEQLRGEAGKRGKEETEGQVVRTGREVDERKLIGRGEPESESIREAPVEQLWERNREG